MTLEYQYHYIYDVRSPEDNKGAAAMDVKVTSMVFLYTKGRAGHTSEAV